MNAPRGYTLIELMVTVALVGIIASGSLVIGHRVRTSAEAAIQHRRAELLLDAHAAALLRGQPLDPLVDEKLRIGLPDVSLGHEAAGGLSTLTLSWREATGLPGRRSLVIFEARP